MSSLKEGVHDLKLLKVPIILSFKPDRTKYFSSTGQEWCCEQDQIIYRQHKGTFSSSCRLGGGGSSSPLPAHLRKCQSTGTKLHLEEPRDSHELARGRPARAGLNLVSEPWVQKPKASSSRSTRGPAVLLRLQPASRSGLPAGVAGSSGLATAPRREVKLPSCHCEKCAFDAPGLLRWLCVLLRSPSCVTLH